jgi:16S rRNA C967 or C1407 C5-methylase (RsmB/RsmF family)/NOL1/NOP2/fmu family ribosome biogenesis protein
MTSDFPDAFAKRITSQFPDGNDLLDSLNNPPTQSILLHPRKGHSPFPSEPVPWNEFGHYLEERPVYTLDPLFHAGAYYPQESSSMIIGHILKTLFGSDRDLMCLDLCASPGGKSLNILNFLDGQGMLISNEIIKARNRILIENINKWGYHNALVTCNDPEDFAAQKGRFDLVLVDAPCSGEGMFRKDIAARGHWSESNVALCSGRQSRILDAAVSLLKPGGKLIYSTCTFSPEENQEQVNHLLENYELEAVDLELIQWGVENAGPGSHAFLPHKVKGEGLFVSVFNHIGDEEPGRLKAKNRGNLSSHKTPTEVELPDAAICLEMSGRLLVLPEDSLPWLEQSGKIYFTSAGTTIGEMVRDQLIPAHALSQSVTISHQYNQHELELDDALNFLRKNPVKVDRSPGWCQLNYRTLGLGWGKVLPNRLNNYLPKELRIKHL